MTERSAGYQYTLVVGPDSPDRARLESVLMRGGLEVAACNEAELLAMPDIVPPQIVILDDSSGRDERMASFANVRSQPPPAGVPAVVLAYDADIDSSSAAITRGAAAYLVKPVAAEEIVAVAQSAAIQINVRQNGASMRPDSTASGAQSLRITALSCVKSRK